MQIENEAAIRAISAMADGDTYAVPSGDGPGQGNGLPGMWIPAGGEKTQNKLAKTAKKQSKVGHRRPCRVGQSTG